MGKANPMFFPQKMPFEDKVREYIALHPVRHGARLRHETRDRPVRRFCRLRQSRTKRARQMEEGMMSTSDEKPDPILGMMSDQPRGRIGEISPAMAVDIIRSETCPACGQRKMRGDLLCSPCVSKLPSGAYGYVLDSWGSLRFLKAARSALNALGCRNIHTPPGSFNMVPRN